MQFTFSKYQGTGNDFILIDNRNKLFPRNENQLVAKLCDRKFGIGADGLMLLQPGDSETDFEMVYYNADGNESTMCGNGGRCIAAFAAKMGVVEKKSAFLAADGKHEAFLLKPDHVSLRMTDVRYVENHGDYFFLDTGSPHYVRFMDDIAGLDVVHEGRLVRYSRQFGEKGTNVNFVQDQGNQLFIRTYERGVENETLSCGTGTVAAAIAAFIRRKENGPSAVIPVQAPGGHLKVSFEHNQGQFTDIWLEGPAAFVFEGVIRV
jgi:diaminopimelate epimerase